MRHLATVAILLSPALARATAVDPGAHSGAPTDGATADVVGGQTVPDGRWPDAVAVVGDSGTCTGTLIAPDVVLTAGHCAEISPTLIVANTTDWGNGGQSVEVKSVTAYPSWQSSYDLAVIVLKKPVDGVTPRAVAAACTYDQLDAGTMVHLVGFGLTTEQGTDSNTAMHEAIAPVVDPDCMGGGEGCRAALQPGGEFVAGGNGTDSCFGDSGGPVYLDTPRGQVLVGAVSRGIAGSQTPCGDGGIYERTDKVIDWIEQVTGETIAVDSCDGSGAATGGPQHAAGQTATTSGGCAAGGGLGGGTGAAMFAVGALALLGGARRRRTA